MSIVKRLSFLALAACEALAASACGDDDPRSAPDPDVVVPDGRDGDTAPDIDVDVGDAPDVEVATGPIRKVELEVDADEWENLHDHIYDAITIATTVVIDGQRFPGGTVEAHGGYARDVPKKSYRVELPDEPDAHVDLFGDGVERQRHFVLKASWIDRSFLREALAMQLTRDSGGLAPRIAFAELRVNGKLLGLYELVERIDRNYLDRHDLEDDEVHLYKAESHAANWADKTNPLDGYDIQLGEDQPDTSDLAALLHACSATPTTDAGFAAEVEPRLEVEDVVIWQRCNTFMGNRDAFTKNYYLYHDLEAAAGDPEARFRVISWDADATFGLEWEGTDLPGDQTAWTGTDAFSGRLVQVPKWRERYLAEYDRALGAELAPERLKAWIDAHAPDIEVLAKADLAAWQPEAEWQAEVDRLKQLVDKRAAVMRSVIDGLRQR
ncbi:MAG: CotH kinase family protein [Myxococcota bacterium]